MTVNSFNRALDYVGSGGASLVSSVFSGNILPSAVLGYTGGWLTGVGTQLGLFQGVVSSFYYTLIQKRAVKYLELNTKDNDPNFISSRAGYFLYSALVLSALTIPIFVTMSYGDTVMKKLSNSTDPDSFINRWVLGSSEMTREYNLYWGIGVSIAPSILQHTISMWRSEERKTR